jgi:hypothetical protein
MALDGEQMGRRLRAAIKLVPAPETFGSQAEFDVYRDELFKRMGTTIITYITRHAEVYGVRIIGVKPGPATRGQAGTTGKIK